MALRLPPPPSAGDIVRLYQLSARKRLAQNFLFDSNLSRKIARCCGRLRGAHVCEVGPGPGGITQALLEQGVARLDVVEKDIRFMPGLKLLADRVPNRLNVIHGDILEFDFESLWPVADVGSSWSDEPPNAHVVGNLPFNISLPLTVNWLKQMSQRSGPFVYGRTRLTLTYQKEVAERIVAPIGGDQRCRLSVICQYLCEATHRFTIPGRCFVPQPLVDVGVVQLVPRRTPLIELPFALVEKLVRHLFHFRSKHSIFGAKTLYPDEMASDMAHELYRRCRISPRVACTRLSVEELADLCHVYEEQCQRVPGLFLYDYRARKPVTLEHCARQPDPFPPVYLPADDSAPQQSIDAAQPSSADSC